MPLYQAFCIAVHSPEYATIKSLVKTGAEHILKSGGAVRSIEYRGLQTLPQRMRSHKHTYTHGDYWSMYMDASPTLMRSLHSIMRQDPRVIRWTTLRIGTKLEDVVGPKVRTVQTSKERSSTS